MNEPEPADLICSAKGCREPAGFALVWAVAKLAHRVRFRTAGAVPRRGPVILVANKVDDFNQEAEAAMLWGLGFGQPWPVSALHGRGSGDALDALLEQTRRAGEQQQHADHGAGHP